MEKILVMIGLPLLLIMVGLEFGNSAIAEDVIPPDAAYSETKQETVKGFNTEGREKIAKNESDDAWEMTLEGIGPMYQDPDPKRGESQKEFDQTAVNLVIQQEGSKESAVTKIIQSAWVYFNSGYPNIAMRKFNQAWSLSPENAEVYYGFGCILTSRKDYDGSIKMYSRAIELNPQYFEAYANRGLDYCNSGVYQQGISDFTKAIEIRPNEAQTYNDRAVAYFFEKQYNESKADADKALSLGYQVSPEFLAALKQASGEE